MKRNYGLDCLRIVLMLMVVVLHVLGQGGILDTAGQLTVKYGVAWFIECLGYRAVNCYALISGYVYINSKYKLSSLFYIYLQVLLYSLGIAVCVWIWKPESFSVWNLVYFLFPVSHEGYWYFSSYVGLFILIPFLNAAIKAISTEYMKPYLFLTFLVFTLLPTFARHDTFAVNWGYSTFWLAFMYVIGACIRKYGWGDALKSYQAFLIYICSVFVSWAIKMGCEGITMWLLGDPKTGFMFISYTSPTIVIAAVALFIMFKNVTISPKLAKVIAEISPAAFGVYLIHEHKYMKEFFVRDTFVFLTDFSTPVMVVGILFSALIIFAGCLFIDWIRFKVFRYLHVKDFLEKIETKYIHYDMMKM